MKEVRGASKKQSPPVSGVTPPALSIEFERATAGERSSSRLFQKDLVPFAFILQFIARHDVKHWRLTATDASQDQNEGESGNTQPKDTLCGAAMFHASILAS
ncbi:MAG: hypothetical protein WCG81_05025 [Candidatus Angelobacter sp.]